MLLIKALLCKLWVALCILFVLHFNCASYAAEADVVSKADMLKAVELALSQKMESLTNEGSVNAIKNVVNDGEFAQRTQLLVSRYTDAIKLMKQDGYSKEDVSEIISSVVWHLGTSTSLLSLPMDSLRKWKETNVNEYAITLNEKRPSRESRQLAMDKYKEILFQIQSTVKKIIEKKPIKIDGIAKLTIEKWYGDTQFNEELNRNKWIKTLAIRLVNDSIDTAVEWQLKKAETYANNWLYGNKFVTAFSSDSFLVQEMSDKLNNILIEEVDKVNSDKRTQAGEEHKNELYVFSNPKVEFDSIISATIRRLIK
jgi:hypothetical protein